MGGFAQYVWPAYGFAALALAFLTIVTIRHLRKSQRILAELQSIQNHEA